MSLSPSQLSQGVETIRAYVKKLPESPGVYRMCDSDGHILYIGKARSLKKRVSSYTRPQRLPYRLQRMISQTDHMIFEYCSSETEALLLEAQMIKNLNPRFNISLTDDKSYPFLHLTTHEEFPRVMKYRRKSPKNKNEASKNKGHFFGPYASAGALHQALHVVHRVFQLRSCPDSIFMHRQRPCQEYQIKRCSAPCVGRISADDYRESVRHAIDFFSGKDNNLHQTLMDEMQQAAENMYYEKAADKRDQIRALSQLQNKKGLNLSNIADADIVVIIRHHDMVGVHFMTIRARQYLGGRTLFPRSSEESLSAILSSCLAQYYTHHPAPTQILVNITPQQSQLICAALTTRWGMNIAIHQPQRGDKKKLIEQTIYNAKESIAMRASERENHQRMMQQMQQLLGFDRPLKRIEIYDNSHTVGRQARGVMVVATENGFDKKSYRQFKFDKEIAQDDFAMMDNMLDRRLKRLIDEKTPNDDDTYPSLLLIDGGKGQLSKVRAVLEKYQLDAHIYLAAIAKGEDRNAGREIIFIPNKAPIQLSPQDATAHYIQRIRDESHRFAITTHRKARDKNNYQSLLDDIEGIGIKRKKALIAYFGSAKTAMEANIEELQKVPGISRQRAEQLYQIFRIK